MKTIPFFLSFFLISIVGFSQNMNTSTSLTLTNVVSEDEVYTEFAEADFDEEISIDDVFDKIALIESLVFSEEELKAKREKHMVEAGAVVYFEPSNNQ